MIPSPYEQKRCYYFLKVLIRLIGIQLLEQENTYGGNTSRNARHYDSNNNNNEYLLRQIKSIMNQRIIQNRQTTVALNDDNNNMSSLQETILLHVRNVIGIEYYWNITRDYLGYDCF